MNVATWLYSVNSRYTQHSVYCVHSGDTGTVAADNAAQLLCTAIVTLHASIIVTEQMVWLDLDQLGTLTTE